MLICIDQASSLGCTIFMDAFKLIKVVRVVQVDLNLVQGFISIVQGLEQIFTEIC